MSDNQKPTHKVFVVEDRGEGEDGDAFWTRVGSAWAHKDGKGFNVVLSALPVNVVACCAPLPRKMAKAITTSQSAASILRNDNGRK